MNIRHRLQHLPEIDRTSLGTGHFRVDARGIGDIADQPVVIGRLAECTIPINDPSASRRHAQISVENGAVFVTDLNSTNGTKVNGRRVERQRLATGDLITIGTTSFRFEAIAD